VSKYFDESHIQQILQSIDIVEVIGSYVALKRRGKEMIGLCPFHEDRRPSLNVSPVKQIFKCFACGAGGDVIKFIMLRERMSFPEVVVLLAERVGVKLPERRAQQQGSVDRNELEKVNRWAGRFFRGEFEGQEEGQRVRAYVTQRGITEEKSRQFGLGWAPAAWDSLVNAAQAAEVNMGHLAQLGLVVVKEQGGYYDRFRQRLIFPVIDALGRVIGFGGRALGDDPAKYLNSPESVLFDKSRAVYGINTAKDAIIRQQSVIVVEGYTDCIMAHQHGVMNVVATLGTALTEDHARVLSRYADRIVIVFDSDEAGQKAADRAIEIFFGQQIEVKLATLPEGKDPCDFLLERGKEAFDELIADAIDALDYKWQGMLRRLEAADTVNGRKRAMDEFLTIVAQSLAHRNIDKISEGFLLNRLAKLIEQPVEHVHRRVYELARRFNRAANVGQVSQAEPMVAADSYTNAQREILEVLLNRPDLFKEVREVIPPEQRAAEFTDPVLGPIADRIWQYCDKGGRGEIAAILAGVESVELTNIMTDMAVRGSRRGNFESTLSGALANIRHVKTERARGEIREMASSAEKKYGPDAETAMLMEFHSKWQPDPRRSGAR